MRSLSSRGSLGLLFPLFFVSGVPALLYQVVWQRALFTIYGTNTESATAVVAAFLLGLGIGAHFGGGLATRRPGLLLLAYGLIELVIGLFGFVSLGLFDWVGIHFAAASMLQTGAIAFMLVVLPTVLMGATLPLLAAYLVARRGHVGNGVGALYFVNTLGSAFACFLAAEYLMDTLGQHSTVVVAVVLNFVVGGGAAILSFFLPRAGTVAALEGNVEQKTPILLLGPMRAAVLAGVTGYLSLSFEMLWFRAYAFLSGGSAKDFALLLGFFLAGIALGGLAGRPLSRMADASERASRVVPTLLFAVAALAALVCAPVMGLTPEKASPAIVLPVVAVVSGLWAALFPVIAHLSVPPDARAGAAIGRLYLANVIGAVAGCLLTGFVLTDHLTTPELSAILSILSALIAAVLWLDGRADRRLVPLASLGVLAVIMAVVAAPLYGHLYERLLYRTEATGSMAFAQVVETKSGVVAVAKDGVIYGGGVYDGRMLIDFGKDENGLFRPFSLSAFHSAPKKVLMIGLSGGAWGQVLANHPQIEDLTIIEINPGYLRLISAYPMMTSLLANPKAKIVIDDGRRWLRNHADERFDAVVMNTTFHWRSFASNVLSTEFLTMVEHALNPGGVVMYNATGSSEVHRTAAVTFPDAMRFANQMVASNAPLRIDPARWEKVMLDYKIDGKPVVGTDKDSLLAMQANHSRLRTIDNDKANEWEGMETKAHILKRTEGLRVINDDNMGMEWRPHSDD
jgi:spermidine synthase